MSRYIQGPSPNDPFSLLKAFVPKSMEKILREKSKALGLPMSRLIAIALDNELDSPDPFNYPTQMPSSEFVEHAYTEEAQKLIRFLGKFKYGTGRDSIMLCRRDFGVVNRETVMLAYREAMEAGFIEEVRPKAKFRDYHHTYKYTKVRTHGNKDEYYP